MNEIARILIVDDEPAICELVSDYLASEGYPVSVAHDGEGMRRILEKSAVDIVLLDVVLPREDGFALARWLRAERRELGIIMLTGRGDTIDRIVGLELGADDYLAKPFHLRELLARIKSVGRRARQAAADAPVASRRHVRFAGWHLDLAARELFSPAGESVRLTTGEFDLLAAFVTYANQLLSRDRLLDLARGREAGPFDRTIDVQVGRLRRKLQDDAQEPKLIKTLRGGGYIFTAPVEPVAEPPTRPRSPGASVAA